MTSATRAYLDFLAIEMLVAQKAKVASGQVQGPLGKESILVAPQRRIVAGKGLLLLRQPERAHKRLEAHPHQGVLMRAQRRLFHTSRAQSIPPPPFRHQSPVPRCPFFLVIASTA